MYFPLFVFAFMFLLMPTVMLYESDVHIQPHIDIHMHVHSVALASASIEAPLLRRALATSV